MGTAGASPLCPDPPLQVVAVVMDMFTDVDLLSEVLEAAARRVPVYILLDEMNAQHFLDMADKCRVNLHHVDFLRVRTVAGPTYYCRTGKSFKGHVKEKFLLVDCAVVMSGSYRCARELPSPPSLGPPPVAPAPPFHTRALLARSPCPVSLRPPRPTRCPRGCSALAPAQFDSGPDPPQLHVVL